MFAHLRAVPAELRAAWSSQQGALGIAPRFCDCGSTSREKRSVGRTSCVCVHGCCHILEQSWRRARISWAIVMYVYVQTTTFTHFREYNWPHQSIARSSWLAVATSTGRSKVCGTTNEPLGHLLRGLHEFVNVHGVVLECSLHLREERIFVLDLRSESCQLLPQYDGVGSGM